MTRLTLTLTPAGLSLIDTAARTYSAVPIAGYSLDEDTGPLAPPYEPTRKVWDGGIDNLLFFIDPDPNMLRMRLALPANTVTFAFGRFLLWSLVDGTLVCFGYLTWDAPINKVAGVGLDIYCDIVAPYVGRVISFDPVADVLRAMPSELKDNPFWANFGKAVGDVLDVFVESPRRQLRGIHNVEQLPKSFGLLNVRQKGINFHSDKLTTEDVERLASFVGMYWPGSASREFDKFFSYFLNVRVDLTQLYNDAPDFALQYNPFQEKPLGRVLWEGGEWWPTSHVKAAFDVENNPNLNVKDLIDLFYRLAPIQLVLQRVVKAVFSTTTVGAIGRGLVRAKNFDTWNPDALCTYCCTMQPETPDDPYASLR